MCGYNTVMHFGVKAKMNSSSLQTESTWSRHGPISISFHSCIFSRFIFVFADLPSVLWRFQDHNRCPGFFCSVCMPIFSEWARHVLGICLVGSENLFGRKWKLVVVCFPFVCLVYLFTKYRIKMYFYSFTPQGGWIERGEIEPRKTTHAESNNPGFFSFVVDFFFWQNGDCIVIFLLVISETIT